MAALSELDMRILAFEQGWWRLPGRQGAGDPGGVRHAGDPLLPAAERADRPARGGQFDPVLVSRLRRQRSRRNKIRVGAAGLTRAGSRRPDRLPAGLPGTAAGPGRPGRAAAGPGRALIALDYDGTLAPIVADPAAARPYPGAGAALRRLAPLVGTLAVITGRPALDAVEIGRPGPGARPHRARSLRPAAVGSGRAGRAAAPARRGRRAAGLPGVLAAAGAPEGTWTEDKADALAVHTRRAAEPGPALDRLRGPLADLAARTGLAVEPGRMVLELRPPGSDKGQALKDLAARTARRAPSCSAATISGTCPPSGPWPSCAATGFPAWPSAAAPRRSRALAELADLVVDGPGGVVALLGSLADAMSGPAA